MRLFFTLAAWLFFLSALAFAAGGVWVIIKGLAGPGMFIIVCAGMCGFLGEGFRGAARREI